MSMSSTTRKLRFTDPHAELPIKNHKYVKNCTELYMANKRIDKIANFDVFVNLEVLWINSNQIQELDGLDNCFRLKQLYAQNNCIRSLDGSSLPQLKFLEELRLYDNKLKDLQGTLEVLSRLSRLRDLDLFGNAVVEEENYRLHVIRAIPSLDVLDRHVITHEERTKAARLQVHFGEDGDFSNQSGNQKGKTPSTTVVGAPSQALSGTVKMLFKEVAAIKREQQKQAHEAVEREQHELKQTLQLTTSKSRSSANNNKADEIPGLEVWEVTALKNHFQSLEEVKNGGIARTNLEQVFRYLRTRGYVVSYNELRLEDKESNSLPLETLLPNPGNIQWKLFVQLFESKLRCELLSPQKLRQQTASCFDKCALIQRRLQVLNPSDAKAAQLLKESLELSQQGYHLQTLADGDHSSSRARSSQVPSSAVINENWEPTSTSRTRFYMTTLTREKTSSQSPAAASRDNSSKFSELKAESEQITDALARKYKIRQKDFTKYLATQSPQTAKLVRRNYQL